MTQILTIIRSSNFRDQAASSSAKTSSVPENAAAAACEALFARVAPAIPLEATDRHTVIEAVIAILSLRDGRRIPVRPRSPDHVHFLVEGWAYRAQMLRNGGRQITDVFLPGDFCGSTMTAQEIGEEIVTCGRARVAVLRKEVVAGCERSAFQQGWEWSRDTEVSALRSRLVSLGRRDARERVAHFISEIHTRLHRVGMADGNVLTWSLSQEQLADVLGLTTVHVNRVLQRLRSEGLIVVSRPHLFIPHLARLHAAAGFEADHGQLNPRDMA